MGSTIKTSTYRSYNVSCFRNGRDARGAHRDDKEPLVRGARGRRALRARAARHGAGGGLRRDGPEHVQAAPQGRLGGRLEGDR